MYLEHQSKKRKWFHTKKMKTANDNLLKLYIVVLLETRNKEEKN